MQPLNWDSANILPPVLLLLLLVSSAQTVFYGVVYTYSVLYIPQDGYFLTQSHKVSFSSCQYFNSLPCADDNFCRRLSVSESTGEWCQKDYVLKSPLTFSSGLHTQLYTYNWIGNRNGARSSASTMLRDRRNRSDINKSNSSPQTTILPLVRVPSNCQRHINLLLSDPDGDEIRCRYATGSECDPCMPLSVLSISSSCTLSFSPTNSSAEGQYAVQLTTEDFPRQTITLTSSDSSQEVKNTSDAISKVPIQFVFRVDPAAPSCTEGLYLPRFLPPTPENRAQINIDFKQTVEINIRAEATLAVITDLLFSGPHGVTKSSSGSGNFTLKWTPSDTDGGLSQTFCFVIQANSNGSVYQSDIRCILVTTGERPVTTVRPTSDPLPTTTATSISSSVPNSTLIPEPYYILALNAQISTTLSLESDSETIERLIKEELKRQGLPSDIRVELQTENNLEVTASP